MALLPAPFGAQTRAISPAESFALVHVTVIDMTDRSGGSVKGKDQG
jgi:hypothetical protein